MKEEGVLNMNEPKDEKVILTSGPINQSVAFSINHKPMPFNIHIDCEEVTVAAGKIELTIVDKNVDNLENCDYIYINGHVFKKVSGADNEEK